MGEYSDGASCWPVEGQHFDSGSVKKFLRLQSAQTYSSAHPASYSTHDGCSFPRDKTATASN